MVHYVSPGARVITDLWPDSRCMSRSTLDDTLRVCLSTLSVLVMLSTLALAVGLYGNDLSHDGAAPLLATPPKLESRDDEANRILLQERGDSAGDEEAIQAFAEVVRNESVHFIHSFIHSGDPALDLASWGSVLVHSNCSGKLLILFQSDIHRWS